MGNVVLVGELNPFGGHPGYALWPDPPNCSGGRLMRILGMTRYAYVRTPRVNLCTGRWRIRDARARATELLAAPQFSAYVLLGRKVQEAFEFHGAVPFTSLAVVRADIFGCREGEKRAYFLPHPSGLNRLWLAPDAIERARDLVREILPVEVTT